MFQQMDWVFSQVADDEVLVEVEFIEADGFGDFI
jgi:hypothetical protein